MKTITRSSKTNEVANLKEGVSRAHQKWIKNNPSATLADLLKFLQDVADEFDAYDEEDIIADHFAELSHAADYLNGWADPTTDGEELVSFEYRLANVEEDIQNVEELVELVVETSKVKSLRRNK